MQILDDAVEYARLMPVYHEYRSPYTTGDATSGQIKLANAAGYLSSTYGIRGRAIFVESHGIAVAYLLLRFLIEGSLEATFPNRP
ncbi:MAG TPA: hypothetical protein VGF75_00375 [Candidatus Saccharimonadales bacterium]|jgi:hypothetical protein